MDLERTPDDDECDFNRRFEQFYHRHKERLVRLVVRRLWSGQSGVDSVVQGVLTSFAGHVRLRDSWDEEGEELWNLLFQIAMRHLNTTNRRTSRARRSGRFHAQFSQLPGSDESYEPEGSDSVAEALEREGWIEDVLARLGRAGLDAREREVFRLKLAGYTIEEIARLTGLTTGRLRAVSLRIRQAVQSCIEEAKT